jgi:hypothetical protein
MAYLNKLPLEFLDLNEMGTQSRGVSVVYGRRDDGSLVALKVAADGTLASSASVIFSPGDIEIGAVEIKNGTTDDRAVVQVTAVLPNAVVATINGSANSFYSDNTVVALTGIFVLQPFGFTSKSITVINEAAAIMDFSFNGVNVHGKLKNFESTVMDYRAQPGIWLRSSVPGSAYRVWSY